MLYLQNPHQRGEDVFELQRQLGSLGFHEGRVDGILGPETSGAVMSFQQNVGLASDGICGPDTVVFLSRIKPGGAAHSMGMLRERERLRAGPSSLAEARVAICGSGNLASLLNSTDRMLRRSGATVLLLRDESASAMAALANEFEANACLSLLSNEKPECEIAYFATEGFESEGGKRLASLIQSNLRKSFPSLIVPITGKRNTLLRESRMPAVSCQLGPTNLIVELQGLIARSVAESLSKWIITPC